jgi:hypothetical protein
VRSKNHRPGAFISLISIAPGLDSLTSHIPSLNLLFLHILFIGDIIQAEQSSQSTTGLDIVSN